MDARKAKSRAAIVAAFSELLREEDYGKITVGDIIARAHVGRATFYGLFKSKDDLLAELVCDICTHALDDDGTPLDDPLVQVEHILNNLWERRQGVRALVAGAGSRVFADCSIMLLYTSTRTSPARGYSCPSSTTRLSLSNP